MPFAEGTPTVEIQLGGKSYTLGWTWAAKRRVRDHLKTKGVEAQAAEQEEYMSAAIWAGMDADARASLSVEDIEEMINPANEVEIMGRLKEMLSVAEPDPEPEGNARPRAVETPTLGSQSNNAGQSELLTYR